MKYFNNKISELIEGQLPNFLQEEGPKFIKFVEKYYEWMETSKIEVSVSEDLNLNFSENVYKIKASKVLGDGQTVKYIYAELINAYKLNSGNYVFFIKEYENDDPNVPVTRGFSSGDIVNFTMGNSDYSGSIEVVSYIQNVTLSSKNIWNLQDIDRTLDEYVDFFMKEYLEGFPLSFPTQEESSDLDVEEFKKFLVKHSREFYQSKGTEDSFKYFFRTIFNEEIIMKYPKEDIFKPSDNKFEKSKVLLLRPTVNSVPNVTSKKIIGSISESTAYVERISRFKKGGYEVFEIVLNKSSITGEFKINEDVTDENGNVFGKVYYGGTEIEILNSSESFVPEDRFYINRSGQVVNYSNLSNNDRGSIVELAVCEVNSGKITGIEHIEENNTFKNLKISGIQEGDLLEFNNVNCFQTTGIKRTIIASVKGVLEYDIEGSLTNQKKYKILIQIDREGKGYIKLPIITKIGDVDVSDLNFEFESSNVGTIKTVKIREQGLGYNVSIVSYDESGWEQNSDLILKLGEIGVNTTRNLFKIGDGVLEWRYLPYDSRQWNENVIFGSSYIDVDLNSSGVNDIRLKLGSIFDDGGRFLNTNSFVSDSKVLQDSKYYQTFSYLIQTSIQVKRFKDLLKRLIHPAGMEMFGNILLESEQNVGISSQDLKVVIPFIIEEFISHFGDVVIEDFQNHMMKPINNFNSNGYNLSNTVDIIDGGGAVPFSPDTYLNTIPSWDRIYKIYKIKYRNLIAAPENESEYQKWGILDSEENFVMENSNLTYNGSLNLNEQLNIGDTFSISTTKPIQKIFLNNFNVSNTSWTGPYYGNGDTAFSPNQIVELNISNQHSEANFEVGGVLKYTFYFGQYAPTITAFGNITKIENLSNGNVKVEITDYIWEQVFQIGTYVKDDNDNNIGSVVSVTRKEGIISKSSGKTEDNEFCIEIEDYENEPFNLGETIRTTQSTYEEVKVSSEVAGIELIEGQIFKVKQIDSINNDLTTTQNSEVKISSGKLNVLMSA